MKHALIILSSLGLILASCEQPAEVELDGVGQENEFEVISLDQGDSDVPVNQVDSVAVLAEDQLVLVDAEEVTPEPLARTDL